MISVHAQKLNRESWLCYVSITDSVLEQMPESCSNSSPNTADL